MCYEASSLSRKSTSPKKGGGSRRLSGSDRSCHKSRGSIPLVFAHFSLQFHLHIHLSFFSSCRFILVSELQHSSSQCPPKNKVIPEPRTNVENCAKKLFSSPGAKHSFTRHPSLIKMAKSIQDDRRKINSAPSSPVKSSAREPPASISSK